MTQQDLQAPLGLFYQSYRSDEKEAILNFQECIAYPMPWSTSATVRVMKGLLASCADTGCTCIAADTAQVLTNGTGTIEKIQEDESFDLVELNKIVSSSVDSF